MKTGETAPARSNALYQERLEFQLMTVLAAVFGLLSAVMLGLLAYHLAVRPIAGEPDLVWVFLPEAVIMAGVAVLVYNFRRLDILLTYDALIVGFGRFRRVVAWSDIESLRISNRRSYLDWGGAGVRWTSSGWQWAYTVVGKPRIVLGLRSGRIRQLTFSTGRPQEVTSVIEDRLGKASGRLW